MTFAKVDLNVKLPPTLQENNVSRRGAVVKGVEHISTIVLVNI